MRSHATPRFWAEYRELSAEVRELARKAYALFRGNPMHPSLNFKKVHTSEPIYSVRVARGYRALGRGWQQFKNWSPRSRNEGSRAAQIRALRDLNLVQELDSDGLKQ